MKPISPLILMAKSPTQCCKTTDICGHQKATTLKVVAYYGSPEALLDSPLLSLSDPGGSDASCLVATSLSSLLHLRGTDSTWLFHVYVS